MLFCSPAEYSSPTATASRRRKQRPVLQMKQDTFTLLFGSSAECSYSAATDTLLRPGHQFFEGTSPRTMLFCPSAECPFPAAAASRRRRQLPSVQMKMSTFALLFCSSAKCSSPAVAASRGRRKRVWHRPGHHDHVRATEATSNEVFVSPYTLLLARDILH